jgi:hypothetical protein
MRSRCECSYLPFNIQPTETIGDNRRSSLTKSGSSSNAYDPKHLVHHACTTLRTRCQDTHLHTSTPALTCTSTSTPPQHFRVPEERPAKGLKVRASSRCYCLNAAFSLSSLHLQAWTFLRGTKLQTCTATLTCKSTSLHGSQGAITRQPRTAHTPAAPRGAPSLVAAAAVHTNPRGLLLCILMAEALPLSDEVRPDPPLHNSRTTPQALFQGRPCPLIVMPTQPIG